MRVAGQGEKKLKTVCPGSVPFQRLAPLADSWLREAGGGGDGAYWDHSVASVVKDKIWRDKRTRKRVRTRVGPVDQRVRPDNVLM
jgi:hypothetical protein